MNEARQRRSREKAIGDVTRRRRGAAGPRKQGTFMTTALYSGEGPSGDAAHLRYGSYTEDRVGEYNNAG